MENMSMFHNMNGHKKSTENFSKIHFGIQVKNIKKVPHENVFKPKVESRCFLLTEEGGSLILIRDPCSNHRQINYSWPMRSESSVVFVV